MRIGPKAAASLGFEPVSVWDMFYTYARVWNMYVQYILTIYVLYVEYVQDIYMYVCACKFYT